MRPISLLLGLGALLPACDDEGITGFWRGDLTSTSQATVTLMIDDNDDTVTGTVDLSTINDTLTSQVRGSVKAEWVELEFPDFQGESHYKAGLQGEHQMTGTWTMNGAGEKLTVKRDH